MNKIDILLLGSGGREHALLAKLAESPRAGRLYVAPGNGGMNAMAEKVEGLDAENPVRWWRALPMPFARRVSRALAPTATPLRWRAPRSLPSRS